MKKIRFTILLLLLLTIFGGCLTTDYNVRTIYDTDREYCSSDSSQYGMKWHDQRWLSKNVKYWSSAGVIVTNWYNVFENNYWLKKTIENGFEGTILIQQDFSPIIPVHAINPVGTFSKDYYTIQTAYFSSWMKNTTGEFITFPANDVIGVPTTDQSIFVMNPTIINTQAYREAIVDLYVSHIQSTMNDLNITQSSNINFGILYDEYEYSSWNFADKYLTTFQFDPASLGVSYFTYSDTQRRTWLSTIQSNMIDAFNDAEISVVVKGTRLTTELLSNSDLTNNKLIGYMFNDVTIENISTIESLASTIRSYDIIPDSTNDSLILIAGIKSDVYNQKPTTYAQLIKRITNNGMYFTSGSDGINYWAVPRVNPGDWWVRNNKDSNWQSQVPTYANNSVHPRKLIKPMSEYFGETNTWTCPEPETHQTYTFPTNNADTDSGSVDFSFIYDESDSTYHIIQIPGAFLNWISRLSDRDYTDTNNQENRLAWFQHFTSKDLVVWEQQENINVYDSTYCKTNAWAPNIIKYGSTWYMYYAAVDASTAIGGPPKCVQRIMVKTSTDLYNWSSGSVVLEGDDLASGVPAITSWDSTPNTDWDSTGGCRDPFVIRNETDDGWLMFASINGNSAVVGHGGLVVCIASSSSLTGPFEIIDYVRETTNWQYGPYNGESPQVWVEDGTYYLQWSTNDATDPWIDGAALKTTTPSDGYVNGNTWGSSFKFPYKGVEMLQLKNGERIMAFLKAHPTLSGDGYYNIAFAKYIAKPSGTDEFYYSMLPQCYDGNNVFTQMSIPLKPTGLSAIELTSTSVKLYWDTATYGDVYGYKIYRGTTSGGEILVDSTTHPRIFVDDGLTSGQTYYYKIAAVNNNGNISELSDEISITP